MSLYHIWFPELLHRRDSVQPARAGQAGKERLPEPLPAGQSGCQRLPASYFTGDSTSYAVHSQLNGMNLYLNSSLWFVESDGTMITSSNLDNTKAPEAINDFDPAEIGSNQYITGDYHGYFNEDMITVMAPVTQGFYIKGYILIQQTRFCNPGSMQPDDVPDLYYCRRHISALLPAPAGIPFLHIPPPAHHHGGGDSVCIRQPDL